MEVHPHCYHVFVVFTKRKANKIDLAVCSIQAKTIRPSRKILGRGEVVRRASSRLSYVKRIIVWKISRQSLYGLVHPVWQSVATRKLPRIILFLCFTQEIARSSSVLDRV